MASARSKWNRRPGRESLRKRLGRRTSRAIAKRDAHRCVYCQATAEESGAHLHLDHIDCKSHGGADIASNLITACRRCNSARGNMTLVQWAAYAREVYGLEFTWQAVRGQARRRLAV